jgi:hypothetical protein
VLFFSGHMIDKPGRKPPRFPPEKEGIARQAIEQAVEAERGRPDGVACGIAGGASGGDILFHEVCAELGIPTLLFLALPHDLFLDASVRPAGGDWVDRFGRLAGKLPVRVLAEKEDEDIWQRTNLWMLDHALALGSGNVTLIVLWNGEEGDGPGGTEDLIAPAKERGAETVILDSRKLFGL